MVAISIVYNAFLKEVISDPKILSEYLTMICSSSSYSRKSRELKTESFKQTSNEVDQASHWDSFYSWVLLILNVLKNICHYLLMKILLHLRAKLLAKVRQRCQICPYNLWMLRIKHPFDKIEKLLEIILIMLFCMQNQLPKCSGSCEFVLPAVLLCVLSNIWDEGFQSEFWTKSFCNLSKNVLCIWICLS